MISEGRQPMQVLLDFLSDLGISIDAIAISSLSIPAPSIHLSCPYSFYRVRLSKGFRPRSMVSSLAKVESSWFSGGLVEMQLSWKWMESTPFRAPGDIELSLLMRTWSSLWTSFATWGIAHFHLLSNLVDLSFASLNWWDWQNFQWWIGSVSKSQRQKCLIHWTCGWQSGNCWLRSLTAPTYLTKEGNQFHYFTTSDSYTWASFTSWNSSLTCLSLLSILLISLSPFPRVKRAEAFLFPLAVHPHSDLTMIVLLGRYPKGWVLYFRNNPLSHDRSKLLLPFRYQ